MGLFELFILAIGLSMDAFAVSITTGLTMNKVTIKKAFIVGAYFGVFQAAMPLIGYLLAVGFANYVVTFSPWIAFALLTFLGAKLIIGGTKKEKSSDKKSNHVETTLNPKKMLPLAIATSIDALAVGVSLAFIQVDIISSISLIGIITLTISMIGVKIGNIFGIKLKSKAEILGGIILIGIGLHILLGHLLG